jgi:hypothetical protein
MLPRSVVVLGIAVTIAGCRAGGDAAPSTSTTASPASVSGPARGVASPVSINALMVDWIDHSGHVLWDAERDDHRPATEADWQELERHATQMAAAGTLIALGGTGPSDRIWAGQAHWTDLSRELSTAGVQATAAIKARNLEALVTANGALVDVCERCHKEFKPDAPTEGLTHKPKG